MPLQTFGSALQRPICQGQGVAGELERRMEVKLFRRVMMMMVLMVMAMVMVILW